MRYINVTVGTVRSPEVIGCEPVVRATWLMVFAYCVEQENGGRLVGAVEWGDRRWQQTCSVTKAEAMNAEPLLAVDGEDVVVWGYPVEAEQQSARNRQQSREAGKKSGEARRKRAEQPVEQVVEPPVHEPLNGPFNQPLNENANQLNDGLIDRGIDRVPLSSPRGLNADDSSSLTEDPPKPEASLPSPAEIQKKNKGGAGSGGIEPGSREAIEDTVKRCCGLHGRKSNTLSAKAMYALGEVSNALPLADSDWLPLKLMLLARKKEAGEPEDFALRRKWLTSADALAGELLQAVEEARDWCRLKGLISAEGGTEKKKAGPSLTVPPENWAHLLQCAFPGATIPAEWMDCPEYTRQSVLDHLKKEASRG